MEKSYVRVRCKRCCRELIYVDRLEDIESVEALRFWFVKTKEGDLQQLLGICCLCGWELPRVRSSNST